MWDFEEPSFDSVDPNHASRKIEWVSVAPPLSDRSRLTSSKRVRGRKTRERREVPQKVTKRKSEEAGEKDTQGRCTDSRGNALTLGVHDRRCGVKKLDPEDDEGNIEYKLKLQRASQMRFQQLVTQLQFRLSEGNGKCFYYLGVEDDGYLRGLERSDMNQSVAVLKEMMNKCDACLVSHKELEGGDGICVIAEIRRSCREELTYIDVCVAVAGAEGSGKSTLVAVLSNGHNGKPLLDNGEGSARMLTLKHKHEIESGKTSSLGHYSVAYANDGRVLNYAGINPLLPSEIAKQANSVVKLVDLGGSPKYLKTAFYGLTSLLPSVALLTICPMAGIQMVTRQHLAVALALGIEIAVVITKIDLIAKETVTSLMGELAAIMSAAEPDIGNCDVHHILSEQQARSAASKIVDYSRQPFALPVFQVSNSTGEGLAFLHAYLSKLQSMHEGRESNVSESEDGSEPRASQEDEESAPTPSAARFIVDDIFTVKDVGQVAAGTLVTGCIELGQRLLLGPNGDASFTPVEVKSIERAQVPVRRLRAGQLATIVYEQPSGTEPPMQASVSTRDPASRDAGSGSLGNLSRQLKDVALTPATSTVASASSASLSRAVEATPPITGAVSQEQEVDNGDPVAVSRQDVDLQARTVLSNDSVLGALGTPRAGETDRRHDDWQSSRLSEDVSATNTRLPANQTQSRNNSFSGAPSSMIQNKLELGSQILGASPTRVHTEALMAGHSGSSRSLANFRKGTVLVDPASSPEAIWEFEAMMVLFDGFWPPRGLISGSWPAFADSDSEASSQTRTPGLHASPAMIAGSLKSRSFKNKQRPIYTPVVHCKNVRQAARVIAMHERILPENWTPSDVEDLTGVDLHCAISAARSLQGPCPGDQDSEVDLCVASVKFRFEHEPVWLEAGSKFVVRDRTEGMLSGTGVITHSHKF